MKSRKNTVSAEGASHRTVRGLLQLVTGEPVHEPAGPLGLPPREPHAPEALGPIGQRVERLLAQAIALRASDLHLDPVASGTRVRYRVDGFFQDDERSGELDGLHEKLLGRIKVLAGLTVYRRDEVQEGAIRREGGVDVRVSIIPTVAGEKATLRIFDPRVRPFDLADLGFRPAVEAAVAALPDTAQGTIVVCGPSGSGKTTTLYALLDQIRRQRGPFTNICSIEDPVEFAVDGVHQMPVHRERGLTFARGLAALLRQDPEVILVGEVRDRETAATAIEAGMTGHLVLTSLHSGSAAEALTRLLDLGVEPYLVASSLRAVLAQRLVRLLCTACTRPDRPDAALLDRLGVDPQAGAWRTAVGCAQCRGTGYRGRMPVAEFLRADPRLVERLLARREAETLGDSALEGNRSLLDDVISAAGDGLTTIEEVARVTGQTGGRP